MAVGDNAIIDAFKIIRLIVDGLVRELETKSDEEWYRNRIEQKRKDWEAEHPRSKQNNPWSQRKRRKRKGK